MNACRQAGVSAEDIAACFVNARTLDPEELRRASAFTDGVIALFWPSGDVEPGYRLPFAKIGHKLVFRPGELSVWTGPSGAGKSQLLSHALVAMGEQGARACIASLEMAPRQMLKRMVKQAGNTDRPPEAYIRQVMGWLDSWLWVFALVGKSGVGAILDVFEYARCRYDCDVFVIDSLMRLGIGAEDYDGQEKAVFALVSWAIERGVHLHLVAHARKADRQGTGVPELEDIKGTSEIGANAFNILAVWRNRKIEDEITRQSERADKGDAGAAEKLRELADMPPVVLNVAKQRNGDWEGKCGLWFDQTSYQYRSAHDGRHGRSYLPHKPAGRCRRRRAGCRVGGQPMTAAAVLFWPNSKQPGCA
ncbi:MAG: phage related protein [Rhodospirillaceae bacterium]|nr:MAG: phage related protein [Rhodospirillaceae bacterium]